MCDECGRIYCARQCPNYGAVSAERGKRIRRCSKCGQGIYEVETFSVINRLAICEACVQEERKKNIKF